MEYYDVVIACNYNHLSKGGRKIWTGEGAEGGNADSVQVWDWLLRSMSLKTSINLA